MSREIAWSLYNGRELTRIDNLDTHQVHSLLDSFSEAAIPRWMVWFEGSKDWLPAENVLQVIRREAHPQAAPAVPISGAIPVSRENKPLNVASELVYDRDQYGPKGLISSLVHLDTPSSNQHIAQTLMSEDTKSVVRSGQQFKKERRQERRFFIALRAMIDFQGRVYQTDTVDISMGGIRLSTPLPREIFGTFMVTLFYQGQELNLKCHGIVEATVEGSTRLFVEHCNRFDLLKKWIFAQGKLMPTDNKKAS